MTFWGCSTMKIELQLFFMEKTQQLQQGVLKSQGKFLKKCITKQGIAPSVEKIFSFVLWLSRKFFKQLHTSSICLNFVV